jgi:hypothetical protein
MEALEIALRLIGGFYLLAGIIGMRAMVMDHLMDQVLAGINRTPIPTKDRQRRWLLGGSTLAIGMGGMALMVLSLWAVPLFLLGSQTQALYLAWARTAFPVTDAVERARRRQTTNAAMLYFGASLLVCGAAGMGLLHPWFDPWALAIPAAGFGLLALVAHHVVWQAPRNDQGTKGDPEAPQAIPPNAPKV